VKDTVVYKAIVGRIAMLGMHRKDVAEKLNITYGTLHNKLCGITPFTLPEAFQLMELLGLSDINAAFRRFE